MPTDAKPTYSILSGPGLLAPWAAVVAEFPAPPGSSPPADTVAMAVDRWLSPEFAARIPRPLPDGSFETIAGLLANALQDAPGPAGLPVRSTRSVDGRCRILLGYHDPAATLVALQGGLAVAQGLFRHLAGLPVDTAALDRTVQRVVTEMGRRQPDALARALLRVAGRRGIPAVAVAPGSRVWQFGHGRAGIQFFEAANQDDGLTGSRLAKNKYHSNAVVARLGLPAVRHRLVASADEAVAAARELGTAIVVKPIDSSKGKGISIEPADVAAAYALAAAESPGRVLVEEFVPGDDHRLAVIGGRFAWVVRRSPPRVTGDGTSSVRALVDRENQRRRALPDRDLSGSLIRLDDTAGALLVAQGLAPDATPAAGTVVTLGRIANVARGGTLTDCSATIHPDNVALAETIARSFHLDATGIDFMTPDITRSWRDVRCAVLEVNTTPGFSSEARAELILDRKFPGGATGRIPAVLVVDAAPDQLDAVADLLAGAGRTVGVTDATTTRVGADARFAADAPLSARVTGLLLDAACAALVIGVAAVALREQGLPLDRFDLALVADGTALSPALAGVLRDCCRTVRTGLPPGALAAAARAELATLAG